MAEQEKLVPADAPSAPGHPSSHVYLEDPDEGPMSGSSYLGLFSVLFVIIGFIAVLVYAGVGPLEEHAAEAPEAPIENVTPGKASSEAAPSEAAPAQNAKLPAPPVVSGGGYATLPGPDAVITKIAFGSCLDENGSMEILNAIAAQKPQLFIFEGDNIYADANEKDENDSGTHDVTSPLMIRTAYATLGAQPLFESFKSQVPIIATWDDHDYGLNDAGGDFAFKQASKEAFFDFFALSRDSDRYKQPDGIYTSYAFGPTGQRVQIILLDTRWNRSPLKPSDAPGTPGKERYTPDRDTSKTMLGDAQWKWLEQQLIEPADVRLLVSSIQVLADGHGWERWGDLPYERDRLMQALSDSDAKNIVILSGDRHKAAIYKNDNALPYSLYEVTSSSLNKPLDTASAADETDPQRQDPFYKDANFGVVDIDWRARAINLEIRGQSGQLVHGVSVPFAEDTADQGQ